MLNNKQREDLMVTAIEGGCNYWMRFSKAANSRIHNKSRIERISYSEAAWLLIRKGHTLQIVDSETGGYLGRLTLKRLDKGEAMMFKEYPTHFADIISESYDAETSDVWMQLCALRKIVYG